MLWEITADATKYYDVVSALESSTAMRVASFHTNGQHSVVAMSASHICRLLFIKDPISCGRLLCDTGALQSILSASRVYVAPPWQLQMATPSALVAFSWDFVTAKVTFLCAYGLLVDVKKTPPSVHTHILLVEQAPSGCLACF